MPQLKLRQDIVRTIPYRGTGEKGQCVYWDEALESFGLRVHPSGRRVYVCAYRINQRKRLATLGRADALSLDQARKKAMAYLAKAANQEDPQSNIDAQRQLKTIDELVEAYIEGHAKKKKKTWKEDQSYLKRHVLSKLFWAEVGGESQSPRISRPFTRSSVSSIPTGRTTSSK